MEKGNGKFPAMDVIQTLRSPSDCLYSSASCFSIRTDTSSIAQNMSLRPDVRPDSSTTRVPIGCTPDSYDNVRRCFRSSPDTLSMSNYHCAGTYSEFAHNIKSENSLVSVVRTRRRKAGISDEDRICIVCGEPASGYNFDRLTCESCKAFFRRNALKPKDKIKACSRGGGCVIEGNQRKHCPSCRLEKCFLVGMKRELILPPEKLEQRAKPRRRKQTSPKDSSCSPQHLLTAPSSVGSGTTSVHLPYIPSPSPATTHPQPLAVSNSSVGRSASLGLPAYTSSPYTDPALLPCIPIPVSLASMNSVGPNGAMYHGRLNQTSGTITTKTFTASPPIVSKSSSSHTTTAPTAEAFFRRVPCRHTHGRTLCRHSRCRRLKWRSRPVGLHSQADTVSTKSTGSSSGETEPDAHVLTCLQDCVQRIREPFTPEEQLETGVAVTLEQEYNRMDACIRRIIRVVKLLPYFGEIGKAAQLTLLRTNIYGLIVLYSSFFFERDIRKLRYPVLRADGQLTTVTVSMLDEVVTPSSNSTCSLTDESHFDPTEFKANCNFCTSAPPSRIDHTYTTELREEFELYKANTLAAFDHLDQLIGSDDILRVSVLAIKLFTDDSLPADELQSSVGTARQSYLFFLWTYLRWRAGPKHLRSATELYARLLIAFIDLRTLEIRMTEFAKVLSLDGLSPLMREVCSQRAIVGPSRA